MLFTSRGQRQVKIYIKKILTTLPSKFSSPVSVSRWCFYPAVFQPCSCCSDQRWSVTRDGLCSEVVYAQRSRCSQWTEHTLKRQHSLFICVCFCCFLSLFFVSLSRCLFLTVDLLPPPVTVSSGGPHRSCCTMSRLTDSIEGVLYHSGPGATVIFD